MNKLQTPTLLNHALKLFESGDYPKLTFDEIVDILTLIKQTDLRKKYRDKWELNGSLRDDELLKENIEKARLSNKT